MKTKLDTNFKIVWNSSFVRYVNILANSTVLHSDIDASLGTYTIQIPSASFSPNQTVAIKVQDADEVVESSENINTIATITMDTPSLTAGTEGNITGTSNGEYVDVQYRTSSPEGSWTTFESGVSVSGGNWTATGTISGADTYDFRAVDSTDSDGYVQEDDVVVASASLKYQITSTDCDFEPYDSVPVGSDKIAVLGIANNFSTTPTIGGVSLGTIGSFTSKAIVALVDMTDGSVDWLKYVDPATGNTDVQLPRKSCQSIGTDGTNILTLIDETASLKIFKHTIADGTASNSSAIQNGTWTYPYASMSVLGSDIFVAFNYNSSNDARLNKYDIATLTQQNTLNIYTDISLYYPMVISNDGTDVYVMGRSSSNVKIVKYNSSCVKQSETTLTPTADNRRIMGLAFDGTKQIYSTKESVTATQYVLDQYPITNDGSNSNTTYAGKIHVENSNYFLTNNGTSAFGINDEPTAQRLSTSDMSTVWNKDYTTDGVDSCIGLHYADAKYFAVFEVSGDFDGDHSGNTAKCLAFAQIDVDDGSI